MFANIRTLFCKWTPWESRVLACLSSSLAPQHRVVLQSQIDAITKIQRIVGWTEIDFYVVRRGRVCWDGVPVFGDESEFRLATAKTVFDDGIIQSEFFCVAGHLFSIESDIPVKRHAFHPNPRVEILDVDTRYA